MHKNDTDAAFFYPMANESLEKEEVKRLFSVQAQVKNSTSEESPSIKKKFNPRKTIGLENEADQEK